MANVTFSDTLRHWNMLAVAICNRYHFALDDPETGLPVPRVILEDKNTGTPILNTGERLPTGGQLDASKPTVDAQEFVKTVTHDEFWRQQVKSFWSTEKQRIANAETDNEIGDY